MNHSYSQLLDHYPPSSGMYEVDSLSDSDWLDIASNHESDDNDSIISGDSYSEDMGLTLLSRRSSISISSSRDGDVDAWEGIVEGPGDEEARSPQSATVMPPLTVAIVESSMAVPKETAAAIHDPIEEQRVNEALDQSMISTLSASRSSTASAHVSIRDLRLSFPDPLTSSQMESNRSCGDVEVSDATFDTDVLTDETNDVDHPAVVIDPFGLYFEEGRTPIVSKSEAIEQSLDEDQTPYEVVLYGSPSSIQWSFVSALVEKAGLVSGHTLVEASSTDQLTRFLKLQSKVDDVFLSDTHVIPVYDRTGYMEEVPRSQAMIKRPSLAVVYLPFTMRTTIAMDHTLYLPVLLPSLLMESSVSQDIAKRDWDTLSIPEDKIAHLNLNNEFPIFNGSDAGDIRDVHAHRLLQRLLSVAKKRPGKVLSDHISPAQAVTFFALMSLIVGFAMNTAFRKSTTPTPTVTTTSTPVSTFWGIFGPEVNDTSVATTTARANIPIITTNKDSSLSIFNPGTTSLSLTTDIQLSKAGSSATPPIVTSHCKFPTWTDKVKSAKDIIVRPVIQLSAEAGSSTTVAAQLTETSRSVSKTTTPGLSVESLSQVLDERVAHLRNEYRVDDVIESLDDLARAIRRQTLYRVDKGKGKAKEIRDQVQYRHERARGKAKELKKKGEEIIYLAGSEIVEKTNLAKKRARDITTQLANTEPWRTYQKAHSEWATLLREKGRERSDNRLWKGNSKCKESMTPNGHRGFFSRSLTDIYLAY